jgi:deoxyribodipyrimidine photo-lyase
LASVPSEWIHAPWEAPPLELAAAGVVLGAEYPAPIVDHGLARERALDAYAATR